VPSKPRKKAGTARTTPARKRRLARREIARRAYEIYLERGARDGHDVEDWLQAEAELAGKHS